MNKESPTQRLLQDFSTLVAALLPLAQLFFVSLPEAFTQIFHARDQFTGVSLITLVVSYVLIIAFQSRPWFVFVLPFQRKRVEQRLC